MKKIKEVMVSLMAIAVCALPSNGSAEGGTNQISNCVNAHGEEMAATGRELSRNNEAPEVEGGVVEPEFENEGEDADVALGESVNEADRLFYLALAYQYGDHGLNQDYANAMRLYREAAEAGSTAAMANIGCMYRYGKGVVSNNTRAVYWFKKAAEAGDPLGTHQLALSEAFGIGAERDLTAAKYLLLSNGNYPPSTEWLRALVKDQDITSGLALAVEEHDDRIAALECAERYGNEYSAEFDQCNAARYYGAYFYGKDYIVSSRPLQRRSEDGLSNSRLRELLEVSLNTNVQAIVELARAYANPNHKMQDIAFSEMLYFHLLKDLNISDDVLRKELEKEYVALKSEMIAVVYIRNQAMNGDINSMADLGRRYLEGKGVSYNYSESIAWFRAAIEAQRQATHGVQEQGFWSKASLFVKNNWRMAVGAVIGGALGWLLFWLAGLFIRKISDWWRWRRIKMEIHEEIDANPGEESEIDEGRPDVNLDEYDDPMPSSAEEPSEDGK